MGQLAKQLDEKSMGNFVANAEKNPKEECKTIFTKSLRRESVEKENKLKGVLEDVSDEDWGLPPNLRRMLEQEEREVKPHQEETEDVNLGIGREKKEVKVGTCMSVKVRDELVTLLRDYQDIFAWSFQDMPGLSSEIVQHKLPLNHECSPVKQKL